MKILVAMSGASGVNLGFELAYALLKLGVQTHALLSHAAKISMEKEFGLSEIEIYTQKLINLGAKLYENNEIYAAPASGSSKFDAVIIAPCSLNSLAKIACGISDNLLTRAAAVALKEKRKLVLAVRETPLPTKALAQAAELSAQGAIIAPPMMGFYSGAKSLDDMKNFVVGKWLDCLNIEHSLYPRWE